MSEFDKAKKQKAHELSKQFINRNTNCPNPTIALACEKMGDWAYEYLEKENAKLKEQLSVASKALEFYDSALKNRDVECENCNTYDLMEDWFNEDTNQTDWAMSLGWGAGLALEKIENLEPGE